MKKEQVDVLVVDDDPDLCMLMQSMLKFSGYVTKGCNNPLYLEKVLETTEPRMILMDMLLSGADGRDVCKALKSNENTKDKKIMMISAHPDAEVTCRDAGADEFLGKPFDIDVFIKKVEGILNN
ncbi:MAG: response regulator [Ferruginibacter sp.]